MSPGHSASVGPVVETPRLVATPVSPDDLADFRRLFQDGQVALTMDGKRTDAEVIAIVERDVEHWERHGYGCWSWRLRATGEFVGRGGLRTVVLEGNEETEVAYALLPAFWRRGHATEIARFSVEHAFGACGLDSLVAMTLPTNEGSRRVMTNAGFAFDHDITHRDLPHVLYRLAHPGS